MPREASSGMANNPYNPSGMPSPAQMVQSDIAPAGSPSQSSSLSDEEKMRAIMERRHPESGRVAPNGTYTGPGGAPHIPVPGGQALKQGIAGQPAQQPVQAGPQQPQGSVQLEPLEPDEVDSVIDLAETLFVDGVNENMSAPSTVSFAQDCLRRAHIFCAEAKAHITRYTPPADEEPAAELVDDEADGGIEFDLTEDEEEKTDGDPVGRRGRGKRAAAGAAD